MRTETLLYFLIGCGVFLVVACLYLYFSSDESDS